jgi:hypothetical protein
MTPNTPGVFTDANLAAGKTYTDANNNVTIKTLSDSASSPTASVEVCFGPCGTSTTTTTAPRTTTTTVNAGPTTTTTTTVVPPPQGANAAAVRSGVLVVTGSPGDDVLTVRKVRSHSFTVNANGAPVALGPGCSLGSGVITCVGVNTVEIDGGDGNDRITVVGDVHSTLNGGNGDDWFVGGTGPDVFNGGPGFDTVDYSARTGQTITGTPGTGADDGRSREHDNIGADVERVILPS